MNNKPRLLDCCCKAGGASRGYDLAGFDVTGCDIEPQKHYPYPFVQADMFDYLERHGHEFDAIHVSPPCQRYTGLQNVNRARGLVNDHPDLIADVRSALNLIGKPYVIENVQGAPLLTQIILCGASLGLPRLARHRHFESSVLLLGIPCSHRRGPGVVAVYGDKDSLGGRITERKYRITYRAKSIDEAREVMGIDWMDWEELTQAIPPAYTRYIGRQLLAAIGA